MKTPTQQIFFTEEQRKIVYITEGEHLVLAPPGSGKTQLLASRVEFAFNQGLQPQEMICLTFTNRAAKGMRDRIGGGNTNPDLLIGNIHYYSSNFLVKNKLIPRYMAVLDEADTELLLEEAVNAIGYKRTNEKGRTLVTYADLLKLNSYLKQKGLLFPQDILIEPTTNFPQYASAVEVCKTYEKLKLDSDVLDFDDLLTLTYENLRKGKEQYKLCHFKWLQLDEAQDLNPLQWAIINLITIPQANKVYFGDYEQMIFSFMGSRQEDLFRLEKKCTIHYLQKNFRSPSYLLDVYTDFAKLHLKPRWLKKPEPNEVANPERGSLLILEIEGSFHDEADLIVNRLLPKFLSYTNPQTAIIVRSNSSAETVSKLLDKAGRNHFRISGFDLFKRKFIKDLLAYFSCLENPKDKIGWARLFYLYVFPTLKESRHFINQLFLARLNPAMFLNTTNLHNLVASGQLTGPQIDFINANQKAIQLFHGSLAQLWQMHFNCMEEITSLDVVFNDFIEHNKATFKPKQEDHDKELKDYQKLKVHIQHTCEPLPLKSLLETYITQYRVYKESDLLLGNELVIVSTVHKAKGLEFDNVVVAECIDDNYPFFNSKTEEQIREDARTLYVAMTRAKKRLCISSYTYYYTDSSMYTKTRSRFLPGIASRFECHYVPKVNKN